MKTKYDSLLVVVLLFMMASISFTSCEKDFENSIPPGTPRLEAYKEELKKILVEARDHGKIWVSPPLKFKKQYNYIFDLWEHPATPFFVGFNFNADGTAQIYPTIRHNLYQTSSSDNSVDLFDNPNTYRVGGDLREELTFLNKGALSSLKQDEVLDFDYYVESYNAKEVELRSYYNKTLNNTIKIFPYDSTKFLFFARACTYVYNGSSYNNTIYSTNPLNGEDSRELTIKQGGSVIAEADDLGWLLPNFLHQHYDEKRNLFCFKIVDNVDQAVYLLNIIKPLLDNNVKYFTIKSISQDSLVFDSYSPDFTEPGKLQLILNP